MSKKQRHERLKIERTRYRRSSSHSESTRTRRPSRSALRDGAKALAAAAAIAGGTQAYATPVRFDNPAGEGHFDWTFFPSLDVTDTAAAQTGASGTAGTFSQTINSFNLHIVRGYAGSELQVQLLPQMFSEFLVGIASGDPIPSADMWFSYGIFANIYGPAYSLLPEGAATYLGVRFNPGDGLHYGWIGVTRTGPELDAFAWGYETDPGVPIAAGVPEPGTLSLLAFGAGAAATRRRRRDHSN